MKCAACGKEFGDGGNCQHCGVDRVTGLANYNGYNNSGDSSGYNSSNYGASPKITVCYACSEIIPLNSTFCPVCGKKLLVICPKCGMEYSSQYPVCSKCGTNREQYYKQQEAERQRTIKEDEERQRKQREWEKREKERQQLQDDVVKLRRELSDSGIGCITTCCICFALVLVLPYTGINVFVYLALVICVFIIGMIITNTLEHNRIEKWKEEHPNDPRKNYL
jgi:predicted RNA-binding Zn-ribbon protein involved in translation (DUF1610 family)